MYVCVMFVSMRGEYLIISANICYSCALLGVSTITPSIHYTMGGLEINEKAQILREVNGKTEPIVNLYGAGEVTAGVHGGNRLGGNSLLECVVCTRVTYNPVRLHLLNER